MKTSDADNPLRRIKEEIRADARVARARASSTTRVAPAPRSLGSGTPVRDEFTIDELASFHFIEFVERAYAAVLRRTPDSAGFGAQIRLLEAGRSKVEILGNLRYSGEGRAVGVRIPWLWPRYLLAKSTRVPILGYAIEWLMCVGGLPRVLRHQRAADAYHSARNHLIVRDIAGLAGQLDSLREEMVRLERAQETAAAQFQQLGERFVPVHAEVGKAFHEIRDLRHLVLSMNHWLASLRQNLSALEAAEADQARKADALYADVTEQMIEADRQRPMRLEEWVESFVPGLSASAEVLDIGSGIDWLQALSRRGVNVTAVNSNNEIGQRIRDSGIPIAVAEPSVVLARIADQSLDGVTILDLASLLRTMPAVILFDILRRVLRPGGEVLFGIGVESATIADRLEGRASALVDGDLIERALQVSGFVEIRRVDSADHRYCVIASQPR